MSAGSSETLKGRATVVGLCLSTPPPALRLVVLCLPCLVPSVLCNLGSVMQFRDQTRLMVLSAGEGNRGYSALNVYFAYGQPS